MGGIEERPGIEGIGGTERTREMGRIGGVAGIEGIRRMPGIGGMKGTVKESVN